MIKPTRKRGGYREGVKLVFEDAEEAEASARQIFELKGRGFTLSEIKKVFEEKASVKALERHKKFLNNFIKMGERIYKRFAVVDGLNYGELDRLRIVMLEDGPAQFNLSTCGGIKKIKEAADKVEALGLYGAPYLYGDKPLYDSDNLYQPSAWISLRLEYDLDWRVLKDLHRRHSENLEKIWFWPSPDGNRFTNLSLEWERQCQRDYLGTYLMAYFEWMRKGFPINSTEILYFGSPIRCDRYEDIHQLIDDFIGGRCAFVPGGYDYEEMCVFLKRFGEGENDGCI